MYVYIHFSLIIVCGIIVSTESRFNLKPLDAIIIVSTHINMKMNTYHSLIVDLDQLIPIIHLATQVSWRLEGHEGGRGVKAASRSQ